MAYPTTARFQATIATTDVTVVRVEVWDQDVFLKTLDMTVDGDVTIDDVDIRRTCTVSLTDNTDTLSPQYATDLLAPYGNELRLYRGVRYPDGSTELPPLGVFGISSCVIDDSGQGMHIRLEGSDRGRKVSLARFDEDYTIAAGTNYVTAIKTLISSRYPNAQFNFPTTTSTTPALHFDATTDDPWTKAREMAKNIGYDLYVDVTGIFVMNKIPDPSSSPPIQSFIHGENCTFMYANKTMQDDGLNNGVIVTGETPDNASGPVRAVAWDTDPNSPMYYLGKFGKRPKFYASEFITTVSQAQDVANQMLLKELYTFEVVQIQALVNTALDVNDVVFIQRPDSKINAVYQISKLTIPLHYGRPMYLSSKQRKFAV